MFPLQDSYHGYDLSEIPRQAHPSADRVHTGRHSYTVVRGACKIEVLLRQRAFFVRGVVGPKHVSWSKYDTVADAWMAACARGGVLP